MSNPGYPDRVLPWSRALAAFIVPFLIAAFAILYLFTARAGDWWAFPPATSMSAFWMGAGYIAGGYFFVRALVARQWHHVAVGFPPVTIFASLLGLATILDWNHFSHDRPAFVAWAVLYFTTPWLVPLAWLNNRRADTGQFDAQDAVLPSVARWALGLAGVGTIGVGLVLFIWPQLLLSVWPWQLTPVGARVLGAWFVLPGIFFAAIAGERRWSAARLPVQSQVLGVLLILLGVLRAWQDFDPANILTWLLLVGMAGLLALLGGLYWVLERRAHNPTHLAELPAATPPELARLPMAPLVPGLPVLGNGLDLLRDLPGTLIRAHRTHGRIFRLRAPGFDLTVLAGPEANLFFARRGEAVFSNRRAYRRVNRAVGSDHYLQGMDATAHDRLRRSLQPGFSREAICSYLPGVAAAFQRAARSWAPGQRLNVRDIAMALTADATTSALTNTEVGGLFPGLRRYIEILIGAGIAIWPPVLLYLPPFVLERRRVDRFLDRILAAHRAHPPDASRSPDLVDLVLAISRADGQPLSPADQRACLQVVPANSAMYTGRALSFLLYDLLNNPAALQRVVQEVDATFDHGLPDAAMLRQMKTLRGAVLESLRLHPPAIVLPRYVTRAFEFAGHRVEAGTMVLMGTTLGHFDPDVFPDPDRFDLDRYTEPRSEHRQPGAYAPFGTGAHTCLSQGMVEAILMIGAATLLRMVRLELSPPGYRLRTVANPVPGPEAGFNVRVLEHRAASMPSTVSSPGLITPAELAELLPALGSARLVRLTAGLKPHSYPSDAVVIREGDPAEDFYILLEGQVAVLKRTLNGDMAEVARLEAPNYFGEIGLLYGVPRTATIKAVRPLRLLALNRETFTNIVAEADLTSAEIAQFIRQRYVSTHLAASLPSLSPEDVRKLAGNATLVRYPPAAVIIRQGEPADKFYIVARGQVDVVNQHPSGQEILLAQRGPGDYFGEIGLLQSRPRTATVRARPDSEVELLEIGPEAFDQLIVGAPATSDAIAMRMVERLNTLLEAEKQL